MRKYLNLRANIALGLIFAFFFNSLGPIPTANAEPIYSVEGEFHLPAPGVLVPLSTEFNPPILKGIKVHPDNPFRFDFILDQGDSEDRHPESEATKLIKYFLASLTIPEKDLWVNLSPYEKNRIIPQSFGLTEMGRDLLAEDYMLKQITASLIYPEGETGKKFWKRIYEETQKKFGTTNIPVNTFNKVWIVPDKAVVYENAKAGTAYVVESSLKVMLEQDYLALENNCYRPDTIGSKIIREIVIPELTKEVNENGNFAQLRQVYNSLILATWYKKKIRDSILAQVYEDKKKVAGVDYKESLNIEAIYQRYLQAFKKGAYNYIKEEQDPMTQQIVPKKYFSGGFSFASRMGPAMAYTSNRAMLSGVLKKTGLLAMRVVLATTTPADHTRQSNGQVFIKGFSLLSKKRKKDMEWFLSLLGEEELKELNITVIPNMHPFVGIPSRPLVPGGFDHKNGLVILADPDRESFLTSLIYTYVLWKLRDEKTAYLVYSLSKDKFDEEGLPLDGTILPGYNAGLGPKAYVAALAVYASLHPDNGDVITDEQRDKIARKIFNTDPQTFHIPDAEDYDVRWTPYALSVLLHLNAALFIFGAPLSGKVMNGYIYDVLYSFAISSFLMGYNRLIVDKNKRNLLRTYKGVVKASTWLGYMALLAGLIQIPQYSSTIFEKPPLVVPVSGHLGILQGDNSKEIHVMQLAKVSQEQEKTNAPFKQVEPQFLGHVPRINSIPDHGAGLLNLMASVYQYYGKPWDGQHITQIWDDLNEMDMTRPLHVQPGYSGIDTLYPLKQMPQEGMVRDGFKIHLIKGEVKSMALEIARALKNKHPVINYDSYGVPNLVGGKLIIGIDNKSDLQGDYRLKYIEPVHSDAVSATVLWNDHSSILVELVPADHAMTAKQGPITQRTFKSKNVQRLWEELQRAKIETPGQLPAKYKGMTQMEIAEASKVSPGRVSAFLNGARMESAGMVLRRKARETRKGSQLLVLLERAGVLPSGSREEDVIRLLSPKDPDLASADEINAIISSDYMGGPYLKRDARSHEVWSWDRKYMDGLFDRELSKAIAKGGIAIEDRGEKRAQFERWVDALLVFTDRSGNNFFDGTVNSESNRIIDRIAELIIYGSEVPEHEQGAEDIARNANEIVRRSSGEGTPFGQSLRMLEGASTIDEKTRYLDGLIRMALYASAPNIWFSDPEVQREMERSIDVTIGLQEKAKSEKLALNATGHFVERFLNGNKADLVYFVDDNGDLYYHLLLIQTFLRMNPDLTITVVAKKKRVAIDATIEDVREQLRTHELSELKKIGAEGRFILLEDGPMYAGINLRDISSSLAETIIKADAVVGLGQMGVEGLNGIKKPSYLLSYVTGKNHSIVTGLPQGSMYFAFVPGGVFFENFFDRVTQDGVEYAKKSLKRRVADDLAMKAEKKEKAKAAELPIDDGDEYVSKERLESSADAVAPRIRADQVLNPPTRVEILWARGILDLPMEGMPNLEEDTILWARLNKALALPSNDPKLKDIELAAALLIRSLSNQAMIAVPRRKFLRDAWRGAGGLVIANVLSGEAQAQTLKPAQQLELARMLIINELERIRNAAPGDIDIISFTHWKDILDRRGVAAYGWDDISLVIEEGLRGGFVPQKSFDSREFARAALKAINDPQKRMEYFFKYTWDGFIKKQRTNDFKEGSDILRVRSRSINRPLGSMMDYILDNLTVLNPDLQTRWQKFNEEFLVPNNIYSLLNVTVRKDGFIYSSSTYGIERKSPPKRIGKKNITAIYGRYMSGNLESEADGISPLGENFVFINLSNIDKLVDEIMKILTPGNQVENAGLWGEVTEAANRWIRRELAGMERDQLRIFIEKDVVNHELTHKTQEILNAAYVPVVNRFGVPEDVWSTMSSGDQKLVEMETLAYMAEIKLSTHPNFTPFMLAEQLFAPVPTPTHYAAVYLFNVLDGRSEDRWVKASDKQGLKELFERVIFSDDLQKKISDLLQRGMQGMDLQSINQAMKADRPPKVFVITKKYKAKYWLRETGQIGDMKGSGMDSFRRVLMLYSNGLYALQVRCLSLAGIYHKYKTNITVGTNLEVSLGLNKELAIAAFNDSRMDSVIRRLVDDLKQHEVNGTTEPIFTSPVTALLADIENEISIATAIGKPAKQQSLEKRGPEDVYQPFLIQPGNAKKKIDDTLETIHQGDKLNLVLPTKEYLAPIVTGVVIVIYDKQGRAKGLSHLYTSNFDPFAFQGTFRNYLTKDHRFLIIRGPQETGFQAAFIRNLSKFLETTKLLPENILYFDSDKYKEKPYPKNVLAVLEKSGKVTVVFTDLKGRRQYGNEEIIPADVSKAMVTPENTGGIDLGPAKMNLQTKMDARFGGNDSVGIKFHLDPAMLAQLQNSTGFVPVIISIQPMNDLRHFLGL